VLVEELHERGQILFPEVVGAETSVETREAEINGVGAIGDRGAGAVPIAGGREEFRLGAGGCGGHGGNKVVHGEGSTMGKRTAGHSPQRGREVEDAEMGDQEQDLASEEEEEE
jgi:hypothetical protein